MTKSIFVFGSNRAGIHGAGAAAFARLKRGAIMGIGEGQCGLSYAIPTKDANIKTLPLSSIKVHIDKFIVHARNTPEDVYDITRIGSGLAGYDWEKEVKPLFPSPLPNNCYFINENGDREYDTN